MKSVDIHGRLVYPRNETLDIELYKNQIKRAKSKRTDKIKRTTRNNWRIRKQKIIWSLL